MGLAGMLPLFCEEQAGRPRRGLAWGPGSVGVDVRSLLVAWAAAKACIERPCCNEQLAVLKRCSASLANANAGSTGSPLPAHTA